MSILKKQEERVMRYWKSLSASKQISVLVFIATFAMFMRFRDSYYSGIVINRYLDEGTNNPLDHLFNLLMLIIIAGILYILIIKIGEFLDILSTKRIAEGLNVAFVSYFAFFTISLMYVLFLEEAYEASVLGIMFHILLGSILSIGTSSTCYGVINLFKSMWRWLTTKDKNMTIQEKNSLMLTIIGVIISLIALFR